VEIIQALGEMYESAQWRNFPGGDTIAHIGQKSKKETLRGLLKLLIVRGGMLSNNNKNKGVILIGNGSSALDYKLGGLIDTFETVVRFSWYHIKGYEDYVGTKTDIWVTTCADGARMKNIKYREVYEHSWQWDPKKDKNYKNLTACFPNTKKIKRDNIIEMQNYMNNTKYFCYSTGAIASWLFLKNNKQITLYGFDWTRKLARSKHHYGDKQSKGSIHKIDYEYAFFKKLKEDNRILFLL
jgi:hypothetical protein